MQKKEELKKTLLDMLEQDREFRHAVAGLIGYKEILDRITTLEDRVVRLEERIVKLEEKVVALEERIVKLEERTATIEEEIRNLRRDMLEGFRRHDEEFARVWKSIEDMRRDMQEGFRRHDEEIKKLREDMQEGFRRHDEEIKKLREDMQEGFKRLDIKISSLGARWGIMNEQSVREALKGIVGKELGYTVMELNIYDDEGYVYGYPSNVQMDVVVSDGSTILLEISSHVKKSDPPILKRKTELYSRKTNRQVNRVMFVTPFVDDEAREACARFGIEVYSA
ncbi:MAG: DUF3782 domain-containing protein [Candidatus Nitrosocaldus sp.]|nr:DUF3782 domain-containing protein [Candidatus Nitrosocaldus sp.]MDW8000087.1 DUF3782 domain-containing protein [Candidatus Nitrosocaldus sp.]